MKSLQPQHAIVLGIFAGFLVLASLFVGFGNSDGSFDPIALALAGMLGTSIVLLASARRPEQENHAGPGAPCCKRSGRKV